MHYWLMKSEPDAFSIDDLARVKTEPWTGVRNYQARNFMRDGMSVGDGVLFYHSSCPEPGIVGIAQVASVAYPDPTQFQRKSPYFDATSSPEHPRWVLVDVTFQRKLARTITLEEMKIQPRLEEFVLLRRGNRLSILPVTKSQWDFIFALEKKP
ncbi:MAG: EVE domain-containing protein [Dokdonella sp.]